jgi:hypothetical protein
LRCQLHRREGSNRLSCHCGKDSITFEEANWDGVENLANTVST